MGPRSRPKDVCRTWPRGPADRKPKTKLDIAKPPRHREAARPCGWARGAGRKTFAGLSPADRPIENQKQSSTPRSRQNKARHREAAPISGVSDTHDLRGFRTSIFRGFQGFPGFPGFATNLWGIYGCLDSLFTIEFEQLKISLLAEVELLSGLGGTEPFALAFTNQLIDSSGLRIEASPCRAPRQAIPKISVDPCNNSPRNRPTGMRGD